MVATCVVQLSVGAESPRPSRCEDNCDVFDVEQADDEHSLEYTDLHSKFCLLFER